MSPEGKRAAIATVRRVFFAGLVLLTVWFLLIGLRGAIPESVIEQMNEEIDWQEEGQRLDPADWDWSRSLWTSEPIGEMIGKRLGLAAQLLGLGALLSLAIAAVLLFVGVLISRVTEYPPWLAQVRSVLRLVLVSGGVSTPIFMLGILFVVSVIWWDYTPPVRGYEGITWLPVFLVSLLPAWLLVQAGHGELANWTGMPNGYRWALVRYLGVRLVIRLLKMAGLIIVVTMSVEQFSGYSGWGRIFISAAMQQDFPVLFGTAWVLALIVVLARLAAEIIEIAYNHFNRQPGVPVNERKPEQGAPCPTIPKGWLIFSLVLVVISLMIAFIGPALAPYGYNEVDFSIRLTPPSADNILGADSLGRDMLSRLLYGFRTTLGISLLSAGVLLVVAAGWAALAAYLRKANNWLGDTLEDLVMLPRDVLCAFPWLVLLLLLMSMVGGGIIQLVLVIGVVMLPRAAGMMREAYHWPPVGRGWLYSVLWSIPVMLLLTVAGGILYTSNLSYLGFGIPPPIPELGGMLSVSGRVYMIQAPWMIQWPAICLALLLFLWVMAGDALLERLGFRSKAMWVEAIK